MIETRFKKTDIGEIPEDWDSQSLEHISVLITDGAHSSPKESAIGFYMPSVKDMNAYDFDFTNCKIIGEKDYFLLKRQGCQPSIGDVLIAKDGSMLKYCFAIKQYMPIVILSSIAIIRPIQDINPSYLAYYFKQNNIVDFVINNYKTGTGVPRIVLKNFAKIPVSIPTKSEQQRIATALSDIDALLSSLNKKIAKKKLIKQGAMQKLLTGKKRLAGFTEPWVEKKLGEISSFIGGGTPNTNIEEYWNGTIPWISSSDISNGDIRNINITRYITEDAIKASATNKCPIGSILLITRVGIGKLAVANQTICTSQDFTNICIGTDYNSIFIAFLLSRLMIAKRDEGQGSTIKGITTEEIKSMIILLPLSLAEQTAIATILSDMDKEIEQLEAKRTKYEQVKQGMMQQLLTGKIRLID